MPNRKAKRLGRGARCSVLVTRLHLQDVVRAKILNISAQDRIDDLIAIKQDTVMRKGKNVDVVFFSSDTFPAESGIYTARRFAKVVQEGDPAAFFESAARPAPLSLTVAAEGPVSYTHLTLPTIA